MNNFSFITPEEYHKKYPKQSTLEKLKKIANRKAKTCDNCDEREWKMADCGLCFTCTTGESDASDDYELIKAK